MSFSSRSPDFVNVNESTAVFSTPILRRLLDFGSPWRSVRPAMALSRFFQAHISRHLLRSALSDWAIRTELDSNHWSQPTSRRKCPRARRANTSLRPAIQVGQMRRSFWHHSCMKPIIGDLVLIHGAVLHKSERNTSPHTRFAYTFHMIESPPHAQYDEKNWLQPTKEMPFSKVLLPKLVN